MADPDGFTVKALTPDTWDAFADLAERHNGVWNGCWCTWFITAYAEKDHTADGNRALKKRRVEEGTNHAALVFDGDRAVAWCEYGTPEELPNIYHRKEYEAGLTRLPDYRLTCFFVDKSYRRKGVAGVALRRRPRPDRRAGRWRRRGLPPGHGRQEDLGVVPLQRHSADVRGRRVHLRPAQGEEQLRHEYDGRAGLTRRPVSGVVVRRKSALDQPCSRLLCRGSRSLREWPPSSSQ